jgi:hypothetical protein
LVLPPNISNVKQFWKTTDACLANGKSKVWNTVEAGFNIGDEWLVLCVAKHENHNDINQSNQRKPLACCKS